MQKPSATPGLSLLTRPLATGLVLTSSAASASAAVVYNGTPSPFVSGTNMLTIDPGTADFSVDLSQGKGDPFNFPSLLTISPINGSGMIAPANFGDTVGAGSAFGAGGYSVPGNTTQYVGFLLSGTGTSLYGWLSLTHNAGLGTGTGVLNAWAYEDTGAAITVGQTAAVPEPASAAAVAALLAGSAAVWKRRRQKLEAAAIAA